MKVKLEYVFLALILLFGLFVRVYDLDGDALWVDEATSSMAAKMILGKGVPVFDSGLFYSRALFFHYTQAGFLLFGVNDFNARIASVIFGLATILLAFFIGREYNKKSGGLIAALFVSIFSMEIYFSQQARFYQLFQLMFFLSLYLLYKSRDKPKLIWLALISFFICIDTQIAGLILAPVFIWFIWKYKFDKRLVVFPLIPLVYRFLTLIGLPSEDSSSVGNYFSEYFGFFSNMYYLLILFVPGLFLSFKRNKLLTLLLVVPSVVLGLGVLSLEVFAFRYMYFIVFILLLYSALLISYLFEKYGKLILVSLLFLVVFPSNLVFSTNFVNVLDPSYSFYDSSAPSTDYRSISLDSNVSLVSFFSSDVEWYLRKPDYVIPFSMDGRGNDSISLEGVDRYSGAPIFSGQISNFYLTADGFSVSKLKGEQLVDFENLVSDCSKYYSRWNLVVYQC